MLLSLGTYILLDPRLQPERLLQVLNEPSSLLLLVLLVRVEIRLLRLSPRLLLTDCLETASFCTHQLGTNSFRNPKTAPIMQLQANVIHTEYTAIRNENAPAKSLSPAKAENTKILTHGTNFVTGGTFADAPFLNFGSGGGWRLPRKNYAKL